MVLCLILLVAADLSLAFSLSVTGGGVDEIEKNEHAVSLHTKLQPPLDGKPLVLSIVFHHADTPATECVTYSLLIVMDTVQHLDLVQSCDGEQPSKLPHPNGVELGRRDHEMFGSFLFTAEYMEQNTHSLNSESPDDKVFRYRMKVDVVGPPSPRHDPSDVSSLHDTEGITPFTAVSAMIGYNILSTHFSLYLKDHKQKVIVRGIETPAPARNRDHIEVAKGVNTDQNFAVSLEASLLPGTYYLDIESERSEVDSIDQLSKLAVKSDLHHCTHFIFGLEASSSISTGDRESCYVDSVEPRGGLKLDPAQDFTLTVHFSCPIQLSSLVSDAHAHVPELANALWLQPLFTGGQKVAPVHPSVVKFQARDMTRIVAVFDHKHFASHRV